MTSGVIEIRRRSRGVLALGAAAVATLFGLGGCATQQSVDNLKDNQRSLADRNADLQRSLDEAKRENEMLVKQRQVNEAAINDLRTANGRLQARLDDSGKNLTDLQQRLNGLAVGPLDVETDRALSQLAAQYPDLIVYDPTRGMLRFAADLTFDSGQDSVKDGAKQALTALAKVLSSAAASPYEVFIVGHTDSQRISGGTAQRHPTNMHLSCHRAISVRTALAGMGVPADKMFAAGWGEYRPAVPNSSNGNTPQNRRVEIYLTRSTASSMGAGMEPETPTRATPDRETPPARQPEVEK